MGNDRGRRSAGPDPNRRPTKAERKEQARLERGEIQAQMASRRRARTVALIVGVVVGGAVVGGAIWASGSSGPSDQAAASGELPGLLMTEAPWPANTEQLDSSDTCANAPALSVATDVEWSKGRLVNWRER